MKRITIHELKPEYKSIVTATRDWSIEPTLANLENLLNNEEDLKKSMSRKPTRQEETALFTMRYGKGRGRDRGKEHDDRRFNNEDVRRNQDRCFQLEGA
ncbi:hypothetical protein LIER_28568 [Lithospermum erythrorhizon]|uniref:Uncharacterized protein n=1 Tax=Lithospermum erythrorhizon TaxID=34254 RepID=A0AAV3RG75_LITER